MTREILQITGGSLQRTSVLEASDSAAEENVGRVRKGVGIGGGSAWGVMEWRRCARGQGEPPLLLPVTSLPYRNWGRKTIMGNQSFSSLLLFLFDKIPGGQFWHSLSIVSNDKKIIFKTRICQVAVVVCSLQYRYSGTHGGIAY